MKIKATLKRILPKFAWDLYHRAVERKDAVAKRIVVLRWKSVCDRKIAAIKDKEVLTVLFLPANLGMWKYESLFKKMMEHPRFRPLILPSPKVGLSEKDQDKEVEKMRENFSGKGFSVVDEPSGINPDLVFLTQAYGGGFTYGLRDFPKALGCYAPYYSFPSGFGKGTNVLEQNKLWRIFTQNRASYEGRVATMTNKAINVRITGYLNADRFLQKEVPFSFPWKLQNPALKKVIYAPHWSVKSTLLASFHSTFLSMGEIMLELAEKYADKIQWCFTAHPWLFLTLKNLPDWGEERAKAYFKRWEELENATSTEGEYISLFMTSDAMIHDCSSFRYEYFYAKKPVMYLVQDEQKNLGNNDVALKAIEAHYQGRSREDVEKFLEEVVLGGNDPKFEERESFLKEYLLPPNNQSVAQNVIDEIERGLGWRK